MWVEVLASLLYILLAFKFTSANVEGDALHSLRNNLDDPFNVLQSWDPTLVNPCTWFHVTCNPDNSVIRVDLGNAALSGQLVPALGSLKNLQYLVGDRTIGSFLLYAFKNRYKEVLSKAHTATYVAASKPLTLLTKEETHLCDAAQSSMTAFKKWRMGGSRFEMPSVLGKRKPSE